MSYFHISAKFLLNVSISLYDMIISITVRVSIRIKSQINMQFNSIWHPYRNQNNHIMKTNAYI